MSPKPLNRPDSPQGEEPASTPAAAQNTDAEQTPKEGVPVGGLTFPDWDILPPNRVINPRIRKK